MLSSLPVTSHLPAPMPQNGGSGTGDAKPGAFSRALDDASSPDIEREPTPPQGRHAGPTKARNTGEGRQKTVDRAAEAKGAAPANLAPKAADEQPAGVECLAPADDTESTASEAPAEVSTLLADLQARQPATAAPQGAAANTPPPATGETGAEAGKGKAAAVDVLRGAVQQRQIDLPPAPADRRAAPATPARPEPAPAAEPQAAAPAAATERLAATAASLHGDAALPAAAAPQALAAPAAAGSVKPATVAEAAIAAHPTSADFAPQLGAHVATFVRDGIDHARLQLHPAELGPVQVQIQLEGNNAQVMMGAEHPLTRQALEQSLPMLAAALREAGLTLAGGGVFEQARQGGGSGAGEGRSAGANAGGHAGGSAGDAEAPPVRTPQPRSRGVVDLVA